MHSLWSIAFSWPPHFLESSFTWGDESPAAAIGWLLGRASPLPLSVCRPLFSVRRTADGRGSSAGHSVLLIAASVPLPGKVSFPRESPGLDRSGALTFGCGADERCIHRFTVG